MRLPSRSVSSVVRGEPEGVSEPFICSATISSVSKRTPSPAMSLPSRLTVCVPDNVSGSIAAGWRLGLPGTNVLSIPISLFTSMSLSHCLIAASSPRLISVSMAAAVKLADEYPFVLTHTGTSVIARFSSYLFLQFMLTI